MVVVYVAAEGVLPALVEAVASCALRGAVAQGYIPAPNVVAAADEVATIEATPGHQLGLVRVAGYALGQAVAVSCLQPYVLAVYPVQIFAQCSAVGR